MLAQAPNSRPSLPVPALPLSDVSLGPVVMADDPCEAAFGGADPTGPRKYYRARYYDPKVGRFISEDPIRWVAGPNYYMYVGNNAVRWADPLGLVQMPGGPGTAADLSFYYACADVTGREFNFLSQAGAPRYAHCIASCEIQKRCGGPVVAAAAGAGKEVLDLLSCLKTGNPRACATAMQPSDFKDDARGLSCPRKMSCEERCERLNFFGDGPPGPFARPPFVR